MMFMIGTQSVSLPQKMKNIISFRALFPRMILISDLLPEINFHILGVLTGFGSDCFFCMLYFKLYLFL